MRRVQEVVKLDQLISGGVPENRSSSSHAPAIPHQLRTPKQALMMWLLLLLLLHCLVWGLLPECGPPALPCPTLTPTDHPPALLPP